MISRCLYYDVKHDRASVDIDEVKDPFDLIDTKDPIKESVDTIGALLDSVENALFELVSRLDELGSHGVKITLDIGRRHTRTAQMCNYCITALFAAVICDMSNIKVSFSTDYEQAQCIAYLIREIMRVMDYVPQWWKNLEEALAGPMGKPYGNKELNEALVIVSSAMGCFAGMNYMESGGCRWPLWDPQPPIDMTSDTSGGDA